MSTASVKVLKSSDEIVLFLAIACITCLGYRVLSMVVARSSNNPGLFALGGSLECRESNVLNTVSTEAKESYPLIMIRSVV